MLVRSMEDGWGYPAEEIAVTVMAHNIRDPRLLDAFKRALAEWPDGSHPDQVPVVEALGRLGNPHDQKLIDLLQRKAKFHYSGRSPEPEGYEAALALARLGVRDSKTVNMFRHLMRENEAQLTGSGVPFAAALSNLGFHDSEVIGLLRRELTHNPNGQREHTATARQAIETMERSTGSAQSRVISNNPDVPSSPCHFEDLLK